MSERKTVKIACGQPGGLQVRLVGESMQGEGGMPANGGRVILNGPPAHSAGTNDPSPKLAPAFTEVDAKFWEKWTEQNRGKNPLLDTGVIYEVKEDGEGNEDEIAAAPADQPEPDTTEQPDQPTGDEHDDDGEAKPTE